ncbi:MAG: hypothetical protein RL308_2200 [Bacteroidota bacterium]|jgi:hypothetical protein
MNKAKYIGESINQLCGVDIYQNKRTQELVDVRSMACYTRTFRIETVLTDTKRQLN